MITPQQQQQLDQFTQKAGITAPPQQNNAWAAFDQLTKNQAQPQPQNNTPSTKNGLPASTSPFNPNTPNSQYIDPNKPVAGTTTASKFVGSLAKGVVDTGKNIWNDSISGLDNASTAITQDVRDADKHFSDAYHASGNNPLSFQNPGEQAKALGQFGTDVAHGVTSLGMGLFSPISALLSQGVKPAATALENTSGFDKTANGDIGNTIDALNQKAEQLKQENPEKYKALETGIQALMLTAGAKAAPEVGGTVGDMAKSGFETTKSVADTAGNVASKVGEVASNIPGQVSDSMSGLKDTISNKAADLRDNLVQKQAANIDEKLGLQKNTKAAINARKLGDLTGQKTPGEVLTENKIPLDNDAVNTLQDNINARAATRQALLQTEGKWANLDQLAQQAKDNLKLSGTALEKGKTIIDKELAAYKAQYASKGQMADGEFHIPLDQADKIKSGLGQAAFGKGLTTADQTTKVAQGQFSQAIKHSIENTSESPYVKALGRDEGDFINTKNSLNGKDLSLLKTKPGKINAALSKGLGALAGSPLGVPGEIAGGLGAGDFLANIFAKVPENVRQVIINNLKETPQGESLLSKVQDLVQQRQGEQISRPQIAEQTRNYGTMEGRPGNADVINPGLKEVQNAKITNVKTVPVKGGNTNGRVTQIFGEPKVETPNLKENSLSQEAQKYKSAEEFVKAQETKSPTYAVGEGSGHTAPLRNGEDAPAHDLTKIYPKDIYSANAEKLYSSGYDIADKKAMSILHDIKDNPNADVTIYRAVPKGKGITDFNKGDWVSLTKDYATQHGKSNLGGKYDIISKKVKADEIFTDANSIQEFGYDPRGLTKSQLTDIWNKANKK